MNNNKIGKFIKTLRKEKGLTQQELGNILYVTNLKDGLKLLFLSLLLF